MLMQLLDWMDDGKSLQTGALAQRLGVSEALLEAMLDELARRGYLREIESCPAGQCRGCSVCGGCGNGQSRVWARTGKGCSR